MSQPLEPPPKVADPRIDQWLYLAWRYLTQASSSDSGNIIMERVFRQQDMNTNTAQGLDVAEKQLILATQIFGP